MTRLFGTALAGLLLAATAANAQETLLEYVLTSCDDDITEFCDQVTPGDGRLLYCMAAHEDKISAKCAIALYDAATILDEFTNALVYFADACETDIDTHCADTPMGEGRILACLAEQDEALTDACSAAVEEVLTEE